MAELIGTTGLVTSWAGTGNSALISSGSAPSQFSLNIAAPTLGTTAFGAGVVSMSNIAGLKGITGTINSRINPGTIGSGGLVTFASGYTTSINRWNLAIRAAAKKTTAFNATPPTYDTFIPGLIEWGGEYSGFLDDTTLIVVPAQASAAATFKYLEDSANDHTLAGNILATPIAAGVQIGELATFSATFVGDGDLTAAGGGGAAFPNPLFTAGAIPRPVIGSLVLTAATSQTYTFDAFWTSITINCDLESVLTVDIEFQSSGSITIA